MLEKLKSTASLCSTLLGNVYGQLSAARNPGRSLKALVSVQYHFGVILVFLLRHLPLPDLTHAVDLSPNQAPLRKKCLEICWSYPCGVDLSVSSILAGHHLVRCFLCQAQPGLEIGKAHDHLSCACKVPPWI